MILTLIIVVVIVSSSCRSSSSSMIIIFSIVNTIIITVSSSCSSINIIIVVLIIIIIIITNLIITIFYFYCYFCHVLPYYSKSSMARTPMACSPWLIRTVFESLGNSLHIPRKQIFMNILGKFSYFIKKCMLCLLIRIA